MLPEGPAAGMPSIEAVEFVRFCHGRRRVGWPELYDEMCAVASRGLFRGMGPSELAEIGVGFSLFETPRLASLVTRVVAEERARSPMTRPAGSGRAGQQAGIGRDAAGRSQDGAVPARAVEPAGAA